MGLWETPVGLLLDLILAWLRGVLGQHGRGNLHLLFTFSIFLDFPSLTVQLSLIPYILISETISGIFESDCDIFFFLSFLYILYSPMGCIYHDVIMISIVIMYLC